MNPIVPLVLQFVLPLLIGYAIAAYLRSVTRRLLLDLCGTLERADFWTRVNTVLLVLGPLLLTLAIASNPMRCTPGDAACFEDALRQTLVFSLAGAITPLVGIAWRISRQIPRDAIPTPPVAMPDAPAATPAGASA